MTNVKFKQVSMLPSIGEKGAIYFTVDGKLYLGKSDGTYAEYGIDSELDALTLLVNNNTIDILSLDTRVTELEDVVKSSTLVFVISDISIGSQSGIVRVPYNSTINSLEVTPSSPSGFDISYSIEKFSNGSWGSVGSGSISAGQPSSTKSLSIDVNDGDLLRIVCQSDNEDVVLLSLNAIITERGV